eukprot:13570400-Alexandrium_andersonii.AAC.1
MARARAAHWATTHVNLPVGASSGRPACAPKPRATCTMHAPFILFSNIGQRSTDPPTGRPLGRDP